MYCCICIILHSPLQKIHDSFCNCIAINMTIFYAINVEKKYRTSLSITQQSEYPCNTGILTEHLKQSQRENDTYLDENSINCIEY